MTTNRRQAMNDLAAGQHGHLTRRQLQDLGVHPSTVSNWIRSGALLVAGRQTFRLPGVPISRHGTVAAACLDLGAVASHRTAAWLHGLAGWWDPIDVSVRRRPRRSHAGRENLGGAEVRLHTSTSLPQEDRVVVDGIPATSVARTILGLASLVPTEMTLAQLVEITSQAVDRKIASDAWLWWLLAQRRCRGRTGVVAMESALAHRARLGPTESWLEREFLRILDCHGVPLPSTQVVVHRSGRFAARVDFLFERHDLVVEVLGYAFHRTAKELAADLARANEIQLTGRSVLQFTTSHIVETPGHVARTVAEMLNTNAVGSVGRAAS